MSLAFDFPLWVNDAPNVPLPSAFAAAPSRQRFVLSLNDILGGREWDTVFFSNYMTDLYWMAKQVPNVFAATSPTRIAMFYGESDPMHLEEAVLELGIASKIQWMRKPSLPIPYGTHHTKAIIAFSHFDDAFSNATPGVGVRVAILTSNFLVDDMERKSQGFFVQDFPAVARAPSSDFGDELLAYFSVACGGALLSPLARLRHVDFRAAAARLIPSVPGYHPRSDERWGLQRLAKLLSDIPGANAAKRKTLVWQFSSLGSLSEAFIQHFIRIGCLQSRERGSDESAAKTHRGEDNGRPQVSVRVVLPTQEEVRGSIEGWRAGMSIPVYMKNIHAFLQPRFFRFTPRHFFIEPQRQSVTLLQREQSDPARPIPLFRQCSGRHRTMPHIKSYARLVVEGDQPVFAEWVAVTSANLSRAAWGDFQKNDSVLMIRSYELGVLFEPDAPPITERSFTLTPGRPLLPPGRDLLSTETLRTIELEYGLFAVPVGTAGRALLLPYSMLDLQPYVSNDSLSANVALNAVTARDVPWAVDFPHQGRDALKQDASVLGSYSHYGPTAWTAECLSWATPTHAASQVVVADGAAPAPVQCTSGNSKEDPLEIE